MSKSELQKQKVADIYLEEVNKRLDTIKQRRTGECPGGKTWNRTPFESLSKRGLWAGCFFVSEFPLVIKRQTSLTRTEAKYLYNICIDAMIMTKVRVLYEK